MTDALATLPECSYDGLRFPVERLEWTGGNDLVEHTAYRRPGADVEPTGRKAYRGTMVVPLVNTPLLVARYGELFPRLRHDLLTRFDARPIASLMHPTLGSITAAIGEVSETADASDRGGVRLTVQFVEHNASVALAIGTAADTTPGAARSVAERSRDADAANVGVGGYRTTKPVVTAQLAFLAAAPRSFTQVQASLRTMTALVEANLILPAMGAASANAAYVASASLRSALYALRDQLVPGLARLSYYTTPRTMSDWEVAESVYGDASLSSLLRSANSISDPNAIPAGRRLVVLPAPGK